jgi:CheY-like chemotaxis protein
VQVLTNLLLNALAHAPPASTVRVEARAANGAIHVAVADEGPGVPAHLREGLLERGVTTRPGGAGIGLRHACALAAERGGSLCLASSDRGARFELAWPEAAAPARPSAPPSVRASLAGTQVLVLEDDDAVVELLETALSLRGADVLTVRTQAELEAATAARTFDAALLDLSPLEDRAASALARLRAAMPHGRLVLISGSATGLEPEVERLASAWVPKPFEIAEIAAALAPAKPGRDT